MNIKIPSYHSQCWISQLKPHRCMCTRVKIREEHRRRSVNNVDMFSIFVRDEERFGKVSQGFSYCSINVTGSNKMCSVAPDTRYCSSLLMSHVSWWKSGRGGLAWRVVLYLLARRKNTTNSRINNTLLPNSLLYYLLVSLLLTSAGSRGGSKRAIDPPP